MLYVNVVARSGKRALYEASRIDWSPHSPEVLLLTPDGPVPIDREQVSGIFVMGESGSTIERIPPLRRTEGGLSALTETEAASHDLGVAMGESGLVE